MPLTAAIVGLSPIAARRPETTLFGRVVSSHAAAYASNVACEVVAVCDLRRDLLTAFRQHWEDVWPTVALYDDYQAMLAEARPDLLSVCTPDDRHAEIVVDAVAAGVRGILCEKPLATSLADANRMQHAVAAAKVPMVINHTRRYWPLYHLVRDAVVLGEIGKLLRLRCLHSGPRAMLFRNGTHALDMLGFLAGSSPREVRGQVEPGFEDWDRYRGDGGHDPRSEPAASAQIEYINGVTATYDGVRSQDQVLSFEALGTEGIIQFDDRRADLFTGGQRRPLTADRFDNVGLAAAVGELVQMIEYGGPSVSSHQEARWTLEIMLGILASAQHGGTPVSLPLASEPD